jgi:hypothetical protein
MVGVVEGKGLGGEVFLGWAQMGSWFGIDMIYTLYPLVGYVVFFLEGVMIHRIARVDSVFNK